MIRRSCSGSAGSMHGRGDTQANRRSTQNVWNSTLVSSRRQRGLNGKNGKGLRSTTHTPGHIGTRGGVPPLGKILSSCPNVVQRVPDLPVDFKR